MAKEIEAYVLDTSALFCLRDNEEGANEVSNILTHFGKKGLVFASFVTYTEFFYIVYQKFNRNEAYRTYLELKMLPIQVVESNESLRLLAGEIKAQFPLSFADAWVAATAESLHANLVHKDPEFEALANRVFLKTLPYKRRGK